MGWGRLWRKEGEERIAADLKPIVQAVLEKQLKALCGFCELCRCSCKVYASLCARAENKGCARITKLCRTGL